MAIEDQISQFIPDFGGTAGVTSNITLGIYLFILVIIMGIISYFVYMVAIYNRKIVVFEKIGGRIEPVSKDKARIIRISDSGDTVFYCLKSRKYLPNPTIQMGRRVFWYYVREDGEWINIGLENIDKEMRRAKVHYVDRDMRYSRVALQKNIQKRYNKESWLVRNSQTIIAFSFLALLIFGSWLIMDKYGDFTNSFGTASEQMAEVAESLKDYVGMMDKMQGGSGLVKAPDGT